MAHDLGGGNALIGKVVSDVYKGIQLGCAIVVLGRIQTDTVIRKNQTVSFIPGAEPEPVRTVPGYGLDVDVTNTGRGNTKDFGGQAFPGCVLVVRGVPMSRQ